MTFRIPDPNAKFIDPEFYTNPNDMRWSGVECEFFWVAAAIIGSAVAISQDRKRRQEERKAKRAAEQAQREAEAAQREFEAQQRAAEQAVAAQRTAMEAEAAEQQKVIKEQERIAAEVAEQARVADIVSKRTVAQSEVEAQRETAIADQQLAEQQAAQAADQKVAGETVGKPGIARTKVTAPVPGGYGGTEQTKVNPTGLNI